MGVSALLGSPVLAGACGAPSSPSATTLSRVETETVTAGGLSVTFSGPRTVVAGSAEDLTATWVATRAFGAVGPASVDYGDGTGEVFAHARFCRASPVAARSSQTFVHRYRRPGSYVVVLVVADGCAQGDRATVRLHVGVTG